jgi:hypothetical protein
LGIWQPYIGQEVGEELDLMVLIGRAEEWAVKNKEHLHIHLEDGNRDVCRNAG